MSIYEKRILVVDDSNDIRKQIIDLLIKIGFKNLAEAATATEAFSLITKAYDQRDEFALVICDHHMPNNSGMDLLTKIRASLRFKNLLFITCTSDSTRPVVLPYIAAGANSFLVKPASEAELKNKILQVFSKASE